MTYMHSAMNITNLELVGMVFVVMELAGMVFVVVELEALQEKINN